MRCVRTHVTRSQLQLKRVRCKISNKRYLSLNIFVILCHNIAHHHHHTPPLPTPPPHPICNLTLLCMNILISKTTFFQASLHSALSYAYMFTQLCPNLSCIYCGKYIPLCDHFGLRSKYDVDGHYFRFAAQFLVNP